MKPFRIYSKIRESSTCIGIVEMRFYASIGFSDVSGGQIIQGTDGKKEKDQI